MRSFFQVISSIRGYLIFITCLFVFSLGMGYFLSEAFESYLSGQLDGLKEIKEALDRQESPQWALFFLIFVNNALKAAIVLVLGFAFGIIPVFFILLNGLLVGFVLKLATEHNQDPIMLFLTGILPHGILEIPAILISAAIGLKLGSLSWRFVLGLNWTEERAAAQQQFPFYMTRLWSVIKTLTFILFIAAIIETFITTRIMSHFLS